MWILFIGSILSLVAFSYLYCKSIINKDYNGEIVASGFILLSLIFSALFGNNLFPDHVPFFVFYCAFGLLFLVASKSIVVLLFGEEKPYDWSKVNCYELKEIAKARQAKFGIFNDVYNDEEHVIPSKPPRPLLTTFNKSHPPKFKKSLEETRLGLLAMRFRSCKGKGEKEKIAVEYEDTVNKLILSKKWRTAPTFEDMLPDDWMPVAFYKYWDAPIPKEMPARRYKISIEEVTDGKL